MEDQPQPDITDTGKGSVVWHYSYQGADKQGNFSGSHVYRIHYPAVPKYDSDGKELHYALRENHITITGMYLMETFNPNGIGIVSPATKQDFINRGFGEEEATTYERLGFSLMRPLTKQEWLDLGYSESDADMYSYEDNPCCYPDVGRCFWIPDPMYTYGVGENHALINYYCNPIDGTGLIS